MIAVTSAARDRCGRVRFAVPQSRSARTPAMSDGRRRASFSRQRLSRSAMTGGVLRGRAVQSGSGSRTFAIVSAVLSPACQGRDPTGCPR